MTHTIPTREQITNVADMAVESFWSVVAQAFPEVTTGDLDPQAVEQFRYEARKVVAEWLSVNHPATRKG